MLRALAAAGADDGFRTGLLVTAYALGLRHGVDWDHLAAIADVTGSQVAPRRSLSLATLYALGHGLVVLVLGTVAVVAGDLVPAGVDAVMERVVGVTLVVLGAYVLVSLARNGRDFRMRSRWMLLFAGAARGVRWARSRGRQREDEEIEHDHDHGPLHGHEDVEAPPAAGDPAAGAVVTRRRHRHRHRHRGAMPDDPFASYTGPSAFAVGMVHGVGAETPTQVLLFLAAAQAAGAAVGILLLAVFVLGILTANTVIAVVATFGFLNASRSFRAYAAVAVVTGAISIVVGLLFLFGRGAVLPAIFAG